MPDAKSILADSNLDINQVLPQMQEAAQAPGSEREAFLKQPVSKVGPINFPSPGNQGEQTFNIKDALSDLGTTVAQKAYKPNPWDEGSITENLLPKGFKERYPEGYFPGIDPEEMYGQGQSWLKKVSIGLVKGLSTATKTALEGTVGLVYDAGSLITGGSFTDNDINKAFKAWGDNVETSMPLYTTGEEKNESLLNPKHWFRGNTLAGLFDNIGFVAGMMAPALLTGGTTTAIEGIGVGEGVTLGAKLSGSVAYREAVKDLAKVSSVIGDIPEGTQMAAQISKEIAAAKNLEDVSQVTRKWSEIADKYAMQAGVYNKAKTTVTHMVSNLGMASSMGYDAKENFKTRMYNEIREKENREPSEDEKAHIADLSDSVGKWTTGLTTLISAVSFGGIFKSILNKDGVQAALRESIDDIAVQGEKDMVGKPNLFGDVKYEPKKFTPTAEGKFGRTAQTTWDYTKKLGSKAGSFIDPLAGLGMVEFSLLGPTVEDYFDKKYQGTDDIGGAIGSNVGKMWSKEGLGTFIMGMLAPMPFEVGRKLGERGAIRDNTSAAARAFSDTYLGSYLQLLNHSISRGEVLNREEVEATRAGDEVTSGNKKREQLENYLYPRIRYGQKWLVDQDIQGYRKLAETEEGLKKLQQEGMLPKDGNLQVLKENFLKHLDAVQEHADKAETYYKDITLKYGGYRDAAGQRIFDDGHVEKMMYLMSMTDDASKRVQETADQLKTSELNDIQGGIENLSKLILSLTKPRIEGMSPRIGDVPTNAKTLYTKLAKDIDQLQLTDEKKTDLKKKLASIVRLQDNKRKYIEEYNSIVQNPEAFKDNTKEEVPGTQVPKPDDEVIKPTIKLVHGNSIKGEDGKVISSDVEVGEEYIAGEKIVPGEYGGKIVPVKEFTRFTVEGEHYKNAQGQTQPTPFVDKDGKEIKSGRFIDISYTTSNGTRVRKAVPEDVFKGYKLARMKDVSRNSAAMWYINHANDVFTFEHQRGQEPKKGIVTYDHDSGWLKFRYRGDDGKTHERFLRPEDMEGDNPRLKRLDGRRTISDEELKKMQEEENRNDPNRVKRLGSLLKTIGTLWREKSNALKETKRKIEDHQQYLKDITEKLHGWENTLKDGKTSKREASSMMGDIQEMTAHQQDIQIELDKMVADRDDLQGQLEYLEDTLNNIEGLGTGTQVLERVREQQLNLKEAIGYNELAQKDMRSMIQKLGDTISRMASVLLNKIKAFTRNYINAPDEATRELRSIMLASREAIEQKAIDSGEWRQQNKALQLIDWFEKYPDYFTDKEEIEGGESKIQLTENELQKIQADLEEVAKENKNLQSQLKANEELLGKLEKQWDTYVAHDRLVQGYRRSGSAKNTVDSVQKEMDNTSGEDFVPSPAESHDDLVKQAPFRAMRSVRNRPAADSVIIHEDSDRNSPLYKMHDNWPVRESTFLNRLDSQTPHPISKDGEVLDNAQPHVLIVHANNQDNIGFGGFFEGQYTNPYTGEVIDNKTNYAQASIAMVYTYLHDGEYWTVDKDGKLLTKVGEPQDYKSLVFSMLNTSLLKKTGGAETGAEKFHDLGGLTQQDIAEIEKQGTTLRGELLSNPGRVFRGYDLEGGKVKVTYDKDKTVIRNTSPVESKIITLRDLDTPGTIQVATAEVADNPKLAQVGNTKVPKGLAVVNTRTGAYILNTRRIQPHEAENLFNAIRAVAKGIRDAYMSAKDETKGREALEDYYKNNEEGKLIRKYLRNVLFFRSSKGKEPGRNQVYFDTGTKQVDGKNVPTKELVIGNKPMRFDLDDIVDNPDTRKHIIALIGGDEQLAGLFHNVNNWTLKNEYNDPFTELMVDGDGKVTQRQWPNYSHYLASPTYPDGSKRNKGSKDNNIPLTTNGIIPEGAESAIVGRYIKMKDYGEVYVPAKKPEPAKTPEGLKVELYKKQVDITADGKTPNDITLPSGQVIPVMVTKSAEGYKVALPEGATVEGDVTKVLSAIEKKLNSAKPVEVKDKVRLYNQDYPITADGKTEHEITVPSGGKVPVTVEFRDGSYHVAIPEERAALIEGDVEPVRKAIEKKINSTLTKPDVPHETVPVEQRVEEVQHAITEPVAVHNAVDTAIKEAGLTAPPEADNLTSATNTGLTWATFTPTSDPSFGLTPTIIATTSAEEPLAVKPLRERFASHIVHDNVQGVVNEVVSRFRSDPSMFIKLKEGKVSFDSMMEEIKHKLSNRFLGTDYTAFDPKLYTIWSSAKSNEKYSAERKKELADNWKDVIAKWDDYRKEVLAMLKTRKLTVEPAEEIADDQDLPNREHGGEETNHKEYQYDVLKIDAKETSSPEIRMLFDSITDDRFADDHKDPETNTPLNQRNTNLILPPQQESSTGMAKFLGTNDMWYKTQAELAGTRDADTMKKKFRELATYHPPLVRVYNAIFGSDTPTQEQSRLRLLFYKAFSRQKVEYKINIIEPDGTSYTIDANRDTDVAQLKNDFFVNMTTSEIAEVDEFGNYRFIKDQKKLSSLPDPLAGSTTDVKSDNTLSFLKIAGFPFPKQLFDKLSQVDKKELTKQAGRLKNQLPKISSKGSFLTDNGLDTDALDKIAELYVKAEGAFKSNVHSNMDGEPVQNYVQYNKFADIMADINSSTSWEDLMKKKPMYLNDPFCQNSRLLEPGGMIFAENGKKRPGVSISSTITEGVRVDDESRPNHKMVLGARFMQGFNMNATGNYYSIMPADSKSEWGMQVGHYITPAVYKNPKTGAEKVRDIFKGYLASEIELIRSFNKGEGERSRLAQLHEKVGDMLVGQKLRFFKDILPSDPKHRLGDMVKVVEDFANNENPEQSTKEFVNTLKGLSDAITEYLDKSVADNRKFLEDWRIIEQGDKGLYKFYGLNSDMTAEKGLDIGTKVKTDEYKGKLFTADDIDNIIRFRNLNHIIHNIELHKVFLGDPGAWTDETKRVKLFTSGKEFTHVDGEKGDINKQLATNYNKVGEIVLRPDQPGFTDFSDNFHILTYDHGDSRDTEQVSYNAEQLNKAAGTDAYSRINPMDGQSHTLLTFYRQHKLKSGTWSPERDRQFYYDMAMFRRDATERAKTDERFRKFAYKKEDKELREKDKQTIEAGNPNIYGAFHIDKPMGVGHYQSQEEMIPFMLKTSSVALSWDLARSFDDLTDMYLMMMEHNIPYTGPVSQLKVGKLLETPKLYNEDGRIGITPQQIADHKMRISWSDWGKITETAGTKDHISIGSQVTKLDTMNLFEGGKPIKPEYQKLWDTKNKALEALGSKGLDALQDRLGISKQDGVYKLTDPERLVNFLNEEITRRELPQNMIDALGVYTNPETGEKELKNALETLANFDQLKSIVNSLIDKHISRPRMNGGQKIQVSSTGFTNGLKKVNGKLVSDRLKFYELKDGKVNRMQVFMPNYMGERLRKVWKDKGMTISDEQLYDYLQTAEGKELLYGIGFRIPTEGLNFIDSFEIVPFDPDSKRMFMPDTYGDAVVVPAELPVKTGHDFDVDKLSTYLKNFVMNDKGLPEVEFFAWDTNDEDQITKVWEQRKGLSPIEDFTSELLEDVGGTYRELVNTIKESQRLEQSLEEFITKHKGEDPWTFNTKTAIENRYQQNLHEIVTNPDMFHQLVMPNSAEEMKDLEKEIVKLEGKTDTRNKKDINYTKLLDPVYVAETRQDMLDGKYQIGIGAQNNTYHSVSQAVDMSIRPTQLSSEDMSLVPKTKDGSADFSIHLPHTPGKGDAIASLSAAKVDGKYISNTIAQVIDGAVDANKDAWLMRLFPHQKALSTAVFLSRAGVPMKTLALFIHQPIIMQLMKERKIQQTRRSLDPNYFGKNIETISNARKLFKGYDNHIDRNLTNKELEEAIKNHAEGKKIDNNLQQRILTEYLKYEMYADNMLRVQMATNWDIIKNPEASTVYAKDQALQKEQTGNMIDSPNKLLKGNFIGDRRTKLLQATDAMSAVFKSSTTNFREAIKPIWDAYSTARKSADVKRGVMNKAITSMLDFVTQNFYTYDKGKVISDVGGKAMTTEAITKQLKAAQKKYPNNVALKELRNQFTLYSRDTRNVGLVNKPKEKYTADMLTAGFRELKELEPNLYRNIVLLGHMQSGVTDTRMSYNKYIPVEDYSVALKGGLDAIDSDHPDIAKFTETNMFYKNNWKDNDIVPTVKMYKEQSVPGLNNKVVMVKPTEFNAWAPALKTMSYMNPETGKPYTAEEKRDLEDKGFKFKKTPRLFRRIEDSEGNPILVTRYDKEGNPTSKSYVYKQINALGDGSNMQEYYTSNRSSERKMHFHIEEASDMEVLRALSTTHDIAESEPEVMETAEPVVPSQSVVDQMKAVNEQKDWQPTKC